MKKAKKEKRKLEKKENEKRKQKDIKKKAQTTADVDAALEAPQSKTSSSESKHNADNTIVQPLNKNLKSTGKDTSNGKATVETSESRASNENANGFCKQNKRSFDRPSNKSFSIRYKACKGE